MAYEKQTWSCGESITAEKLNHMEEGIESASQGGGGDNEAVYVQMRGTDSHTYTSDHTVGEIQALMDEGKAVFAVYKFEVGGMTMVAGTSVMYVQTGTVTFNVANGTTFYNNDVSSTDFKDSWL